MSLLNHGGHRTSILASDIEDVPALGERLARFPWGLLFLILMVTGIGLGVLYSAVGGGENVSLLLRQLGRFGGALTLMLMLAFVGDYRLFRRYAYVIYGITLLLLILVLIKGSVGMGARRWLDLGLFRFQPSEVMKVALVLALGRYFHDRAISKGVHWRDIWTPAAMILVPLGLIVQQPDLGTAVMVSVVGCVVVFAAGLSWKGVFAGLATLGLSLPMAWNFMHDYQQQRVRTLFFPEEDPLGAGYHIIQSKIAVGSGGVMGKGFMAGSQSHLDFLPERHTDFIFSVLAEEWGFFGALFVLLLYMLIILRGLMISASARDRFGLLVGVGLTALFGIQMVINIGMVLGLLPVVGIPLPLVSYGGSSLLTVMIAMGLLAHISIHSRHAGHSV
ncbi:MAG: rod shape-determining protein RodA [Magnetococcales bacterium]|nr:rod shape-determining protein RodA [Magnetococcales bacterium]